MHKSICALNDPIPGKCDCGHLEREYIAPLIEARKRIAELESEIARYKAAYKALVKELGCVLH